MSVRRSIVVLSAVTLAFPAAFFAVRANQIANQPAPTANYQLHTVALGDVELTVSAVGRIESDRETNLSFNAAGRVTAVHGEVGGLVNEGDILAELDNTNQRLALDQAMIGLEMARLRRDQALSGPDEAQIIAAEANIAAAQGAANAAASAVSAADIQTAQLSYDAAAQALADAQLARQTASGGQTQAAYDLLDAQVGEASFNLEIARLQLEQIQAGNPAQVGAAYSQVEQAQAALAQLLAGPTQTQIAALDAAIAQAQIQVEAAERALTRTQIVAPFSGVISSLNAEVGALAVPGVPLITLTDIDPLRLTVQVDEIDVREISEGMPARISLDALEDIALGGTLESIAVTATNTDGIVNYDVRVRLDGLDERVRVGMTAESSFIAELLEDVVVAPNAYIRIDRTTGRAYVNVVAADGQLAEREVMLGLQGRDLSQILEGLAPGDVIAVNLAGDAIGLFGS
ncbi:MAG: efflux RND transporter periplasmic adaptor subunit [Pleurocapsa minor GSE-CHR-MK-17-07R]|nr:efflux RND transporter periplasmic adaptor subunit [Pleurocapsa minor GSE-CHR-MK 17-07R]